MRIVTKVTVSKRRNEWGEWVVRAYDQFGARFEQADYHTDDRTDAEQTARAILTAPNVTAEQAAEQARAFGIMRDMECLGK